MKLHYRELKNNLQIAIPMMITGLGHVLYGLVDNLMVGNFLGAEKLAGISLANAIFFLCITLVIGASTIITPLIAAAHAEENYEKQQEIFNNSVFFIGFLSISIYIIVLFAPYVLQFLPTDNQKIHAIAQEYLIIRSGTLLFFGVFLILF